MDILGLIEDVVTTTRSSGWRPVQPWDLPKKTIPMPTQTPTHIDRKRVCQNRGKVFTHILLNGKHVSVECGTEEACIAHGGIWNYLNAEGTEASCNIVTKKKREEKDTKQAIPPSVIGLGALLLVGVAAVAIMGVRK